MLLLALACTAEDPLLADDTDRRDSGVEDNTPHAPEPRPYVGTCPDMSKQTQTISTAAGQERDFLMRLPEDPTGAPVWFEWHPLGGSAQWSLQAFQLSELADQGWIVVAPEAATGADHPAFEWGFIGDEEMREADLALFDDLLACLYEQHQVDLDRVYSTGFSAGALWTSMLTVMRSEQLAATAPLSGGIAAEVEVEPLARSVPVLLTWGGSQDLYGPFSFEDATLNMTEVLQDNGSWVGLCEHNGGHTPPNGSVEYRQQFFEDHPWGVEAEPYAEALPESFPSMCWVVE